ncbi:hypothetical protein [Yinghuangia seranimata]|uniref:hypothetical protein n=1 Tax=Yinghuangia seranimata TaxID=408067 RepID=UPI00248C4873|nr:hypothetical protein [Yinghuangia seranimata]MDI2127751.1 hypothetical protein [Yinghuangia seranimata]
MPLWQPAPDSGRPRWGRVVGAVAGGLFLALCAGMLVAGYLAFRGRDPAGVERETRHDVAVVLAALGPDAAAGPAVTTTWDACSNELAPIQHEFKYSYAVRVITSDPDATLEKVLAYWRKKGRTVWGRPGVWSVGAMGDRGGSMTVSYVDNVLRLESTSECVQTSSDPG